jgi:hypothetical protein
MTKLLLFALLLQCSLAVGGTPTSPMEAGSANLKTEETVSREKAEASTALVLPVSPSEVAMGDPATKDKYLKAMQRYYQYREDGYAYRSRVFDWQLNSSRMIFGIVVLLVLAGLCFAAIQFYVAMVTASHARGRAATAAKADPKAAPPPVESAQQASPLATQLEISAKGIIVNSSVLGVVILALSLAFFYLYLVYVYPIHEVL